MVSVAEVLVVVKAVEAVETVEAAEAAGAVVVVEIENSVTQSNWEEPFGIIGNNVI